MTKLLAITILICGLCASRAALVSSNLLTLTSLNLSTNTGSAIVVGSASIYPSPTFMIQSVGTGGTNGAGGRILMGMSTNTANMSVVGSYSATNDTIAAVTLTNSGTITIYCAFQGYNTTNIPIQIGAQLIQNK